MACVSVSVRRTWGKGFVHNQQRFFVKLTPPPRQTHNQNER